MYTFIIAFILSIAIIIAILKEAQKWNNAENSFKIVDKLHESEWNGSPGDELLAWYRVRQAVFADSLPSDRRNGRLNAINVRIEQCRYRNKKWQTITPGRGKNQIMSTQN